MFIFQVLLSLICHGFTGFTSSSAANSVVALPSVAHIVIGGVVSLVVLALRTQDADAANFTSFLGVVFVIALASLAAIMSFTSVYHVIKHWEMCVGDLRRDFEVNILHFAFSRYL